MCMKTFYKIFPCQFFVYKKASSIICYFISILKKYVGSKICFDQNKALTRIFPRKSNFNTKASDP